MKVKVIYADNGYKFSKDPNQMLSVGPELNGLLVEENENGKKKEGNFDRYQQGGLGCVTKEGPKSLYNDRNMDVRSAIPYYGECLEGEIKIFRLPREEREKRAKAKEEEKAYKLPALLDPKWIFKVPHDYVTSPNEFYIITPEGKTKDGKYQYILLEDTGIKGETTALKDGYMETEKVPYRIFRQVNHVDGEKYFVHTPQVAAMKVAYGKNGAYHVGQIIGQFYDKYYADFDRALVDAGRQFEERLGFNPASIWLHDRPGFAYLFEMIRRSADGDKFENGKKAHNTFHNPGRDYQGWFGEIESFMKIAFDESDFIKLKNHPQYYSLKRILSKPKEKITVGERKVIEAFFKPYFEKMLDEMGTTNQTMIPIAAAKINPENTSLGTVSKTYGIEMISLNDIAKGLTKPLFLIKDKIINVTNGSLPASLNLNGTSGNFGVPGNGISSLHKREFIPYEPVFTSNHEVVNYDKSYLDYLNEQIEMYKSKGENISPDEKKELNQYVNIVKEYNKEEPTLAELKKKVEETKTISGECKELLKLVDNEFDNTEIKIDDLIKTAEKNNLNNIKAKLEGTPFSNNGNIIDKISISDFKKEIVEKADKAYEKAENAYWSLSDKINLYTIPIKEVRERNKAWYLDLVSKQYVSGDPEKTKQNLEKLFFDKAQRENKKLEVHGYITSSGDGRDKIYANWGRPDNQKGFSTFLQGFYKFLSMKPKEGATKEEIEKLEDMKSHAKLIFGSGGGKWEKDAPDFKIISEYIDKIQKLDNGKYAGSVCYINGFFPNRLASCSDFGFFTSRFEPCGITPLESYASGTPVASIRTGGAPDFVGDIDEVGPKEATGFLTEHSFMRNDDDLEKNGYMNIAQEKKKIMGDSKEWTEDMEKKYAVVLDEKRRDAASDEIANMFFRTMSIANDEKAYDNLSKNCLAQLIEWAKNKKYNRDYVRNSDRNYTKDTTVSKAELKPAVDIYLEDAYGVTGEVEEGKSREFIRPRSTEAMKKLTGEFPEHVDIEGIIKENSKEEEEEENAEDDFFNYSDISFKGLASLNSLKIYSKPKSENNNKTKVFIG